MTHHDLLHMDNTVQVGVGVWVGVCVGRVWRGLDQKGGGQVARCARCMRCVAHPCTCRG